MSQVAACADRNTWSKTRKPSRLRPVDRVLWASDNVETLWEIGKAVEVVQPGFKSHNGCSVLKRSTDNGNAERSNANSSRFGMTEQVADVSEG